MGLRKVSDNAEISHTTSVKVTKPLCKKIMLQSKELPDVTEVKEAKTTAIGAAKTAQKLKNEGIKAAQNPRMKRTLEQLAEPGASSWLGALPIQSQGFNLTKNEFHDALALRYNMSIKNLPSKCPCGQRFDPTHALNCHLGGFVNARHDNIRDLECNLLKTVVNDVECEPNLQPVTNKSGYSKLAKLEDEARLDFRARGFWRYGQNGYFDVCVTNADCASQQDSTVKSILQKHENRKKNFYRKRVMEVEHGSFTPLIFTTTGVMGPECSVFHKTLAQKISNKKKERYEDIVRFMRIKFSYLALKSTLLCLRGSRSIRKESEVDGDFGLALNELGF